MHATENEIPAISVVREQVTDALRRAATTLAGSVDTHASERAGAALREARGALIVVGLEALARFLEELEAAVADVGRVPERAGGEALVAIRRAIQAMDELLERVAIGAACRPLALYPAYRDLCGITGREGSESDLFFPDLSLGVAPEDAAGQPIDPHAPRPVLSERRSRFQSGLLRFLKDDRGGAVDMREALQGVRLLAGTPRQRAFWWAVEGLLEALATGGLEAGQPVKRLCGRVDLEFRRLCEGNGEAADPIMREVLYHVAKAEAVTDTARAIATAFRLSGLLESEALGAAPGLQGEGDPERIRIAVQGAQAAWERHVSGEAEALAELRATSRELIEACAPVRSALYRDLVAAIERMASLAADGAGAPDPALAEDLVGALTLAEAMRTDLAALPQRFAAHIDAIAQRVRRRVAGQEAGPVPALPAGLVHDQENVRVAAAELGKVVAEIEQGVEAAFAEPDKRHELARLNVRFPEMAGVLLALGQTREADECARVQAMVQALATSSAPAGSSEWTAVADVLAAFARRIDGLGRASSEPEAQVDGSDQPASREGAGSADALFAPPAAEAEVPPAVEPELSDDMRELREVFLEEAAELLAAIGEQLPKLRASAAERAPVVEIRRAFHTLKGSGRIAGLTELGDTAWCVERLLNGWLENKRETSESLVELLAQAERLFSDWIAQLRAGRVNIDPRPIEAAVEALRSGAPAAPVPASGPAATPVSPASPAVVQDMPSGPAPGSTTIAIGGVVLQRDLYQIFIGEAQRHVATLVRKAALLASDATGPLSDEFVRAAHTLGGIAATAQMHSLSELGYALEDLLHRLAGQQRAPELSELVQRAVERASAMVRDIGEQSLPLSDDDLTHALRTASVEPVDSASRALPDLPDALGEIRNLPLDFTDDVDPAGPVTLASAESIPTPDAASADAKSVRPVTIVEGEVDEVIAALLNSYTGPIPQADSPAATAESPTILRDGALANTALTLTVIPPTQLTLTGMSTALAQERTATTVFGPALPLDQTGPLEQPAPEERRKARVADDIDEDLLPVFLEEADELTPQAAESLRRLSADANDAEALHALKRLLHTLKGSARMAGAMVAGELAHAMETRVESLDLGRGPSAALLEEVQGSFDRFGELLDRLRHGGARLDDRSENAVRSEPGADRAMLRVRAGTVDRLVNQAGEVSIARSRVQGEVRTLRGALGDLTENIIRLRNQLREIEIQAEAQLQSSVSRDAEAIFDPLEFDRFTRFQELTRAMAESVNDVATLQQALAKALDQSESALLAQARLSRELQDGLMSVRLVPFSSLAERLHRIVRQTARETGKGVSLEIEGGHIELDRSVLERMTAPFEHLLRNAVIHGIEAAARRTAIGKDATGRIRIELRHDGNEVHIGVADDGRGLDLDAIRSRALALGLIDEQQERSERQLAELIFAPGFSTAEQITLMAGRGVGMDVVKNEIGALGGRIDLEFERDRGTRFVVHLPLTLGLKRSLLVEADGRIYALPLQTIEQVMTFKADVIDSLQQTRAAEWQGRRYPFHHLAELLGVAAAAPDPKRGSSVLMVRSGVERLALQVDRIAGIQELVTKRLGAQLEHLVGVTGAAVLGTGQIVLLINPVELAARSEARSAGPIGQAPTAASVRRQPLILVVDDSLTVRKVTGRLLGRAGYEVVTAKDGMDAVNQLEARIPDAMLVDIEMPRMDGFELTKHVRGHSRWQHIPILMVTSRDAEKHRSYAFELGVNAFLGKPYQEEELLIHLNRFLHPEHGARAA